MLLRLILCSAWFFVFGAGAFCQAPTGLVHLTIEQGLPSNNVYSVIPDRYGYIWMATNNGVVKYNGYSLRVFNMDDGLPTNDVWKLYEDQRGRIWLLCHSHDLGYIKDDRFHSVHLSKGNYILPRGIAEKDSTVVVDFIENVQTHTAIIKDTLVRIVTAADLTRYANARHSFFVLADKEHDDLWAITGKNLYTIKVKEGMMVEKTPLRNIFVDRLSYITKDKSGSRWYSTFTEGVYVEPFSPPSEIIIPSLLLQPLVENAINHGLIHEIDDGRLLISLIRGATEREIVCKIDDNGVGRQRAGELRSNSIHERSSYGNVMTGELLDIFRKYEKMDIAVEYLDKQFPNQGTIVSLYIKGYKTLER